VAKGASAVTGYARGNSYMASHIRELEALGYTVILKPAA
jgi:hypothetical protein